MSDLIKPMNLKNSNPITGITLEGFQVFDKPTYIPLDRLTLLFGPNSAGKSAVQDAFELYAALLSKGADSYYSNSKVDELLKRHWRRIGGSNDRWVDRLSIAIIHTTQCDMHSFLGTQLGRKVWGELLANNSDAYELESRWHFQRKEGDKLSFSSCFELFIESDLLVRHSYSELVVNLLHPLLSQTQLAINFAEVARTCPNEVSLKEGHFAVRGYFFGFHPAGPHSGEENNRWLRYAAVPGDNDANTEDSALLLAAIAELSLLLGNLLASAAGNSDFRPTTVEASRMVPKHGDLTFEVGDLDDPIPQIAIDGDKKYKTLAESVAAKLTNPPYPPLAKRQGYADNVNLALSDDLFLENGYRLDYEFRVLMSKANSQAAIDGAELDQSEFGYLVELFLRDGEGRKHLFEDVGSGIGYVLPVLCAIFDPSPDFSTCFIQQPELHIHPALQAAMGDVFIKGRGTGKQVLLETHSEHLLLRILKRIRQTHLQASIAPELKICADDVCVLYFDPSPDGTTTVKRLRITEDGEFMDRWPRGFFGERDQELLDE